MSKAKNKLKTPPKNAGTKSKPVTKPANERSRKPTAEKQKAGPSTAATAENPVLPASNGSDDAAPALPIVASAPVTSTTVEASSGPAPRNPDPRLPTPGTTIKKLDREGKVRCECTVESDGSITYRGRAYSSISSAALAASRDLGLGGKSQNGYMFWGLIKPSRRPSDPIADLERTWERYRLNAEALMRGCVTKDNRASVLAAIGRHAEAFDVLREKVE